MSQEKPSIDCLRKWTHNWFLNVAVAQYFVEFYLWEVFLNKYPVKHLIELGTWAGGMSTWLLTQCYGRGIGFDTFDINEKEPECFKMPLQTLLGLREKFHAGNIFDENFELVTGIIERSPRPFTLYCDNGNKPLEFKTFVPFLKSGDFVAVHDWGTEFKEKDIIYDNVEQIMKEYTDGIGSMNVFFKVK